MMMQMNTRKKDGGGKPASSPVKFRKNYKIPNPLILKKIPLILKKSSYLKYYLAWTWKSTKLQFTKL